MRDHPPIVLEEFNGLWKRGDEDSCPLDHFTDCVNIQFFESGFETRPGINTFINEGSILRMYNFVMQTGESLLILNASGQIKHVLLDGTETVYTILTVSGMTDFDFHSYNGRAYITPFKTYTKPTGETYQAGLEGEFIYVYKGDGTAARKAAGFPPVNGGDSALIAYPNHVLGVVTTGIHVIGVTAATFTGEGELVDESGGLGLEGVAVVFSPEDMQIALNGIPIGDSPEGATGKNVYMTKAIPVEEFNPEGDIRDNHTFYFVKSILDNDTSSTIINTADEDLVNEFAPGGLSTLTNSPMWLENSSNDGYCDLGLHVVGVVYETDTGYLTAPGPEFFAVQTYVNERKSIIVHGIPVPTDPAVIKKHLVSTVALAEFNGNNRAETFAYQMFFIPGGTMEDEDITDTTKNVNYYDSELIDDASYLVDNLSELPAGVGLTTYHSRLVSWGEFGENQSLFRFSAPGEPEAFDQVDGFVIFPLDGRPGTNGQEFRDVFYMFKQTKTQAVNDNGDDPSTWMPILIDNGLGASVHGISAVLDSDGVNVDYFLICDWSGIMIFNGRYAWPELTFKIENFWREIDRDSFSRIQIVNDSIEHVIYITLPDKRILIGDYDNGLDPKKIRWAPWLFDVDVTTLAIIETNSLLIGADQLSAESLLRHASSK